MQKYDYDAQIARLTENPELIGEEWSEAVGLFQMLGRNGDERNPHCGCLTMVKEMAGDFHPVINGKIDELLESKILADPRVPCGSSNITPESLPVFKEYQLLIDKMYE